MRCRLLLVLLFLPLYPCLAQTDVLCTIGQDTITAGEFRYAYNKNRGYTQQHDPLTVDEFLQAYILYRRKVADAISLGMDTAAAFLQEYRQYRDYQLTAYLLDSAHTEAVYQDTYARIQREVDASHILLAVKTPQDDSATRALAYTLRQQLLEGVPFDSLARQYSNDPSVAHNGGHLGYFGAFMMVYPFEIAAYTTPVGQISQPVRTQFGYHLVRVNATRPARGQMRVAHIMRLLPQPPPDSLLVKEKKLLDSLFMRLSSGESFESLVEHYSQDQGSRSQGGELPWVTVGRFPSQFVEACFALQNDGDLSPVIATPFGLHIIKRLEYKPVPNYDQARDYIRSNLARVGIQLEGDGALLHAMERMSQSLVRPEILERLATFYDKANDTSNMQLPSALAQASYAQVGSTQLSIADLHNTLLARVKGKPSRQDMMALAKELFTHEVERVAVYRLCQNNPSLRYLLNEFYSGLLLFDVSEYRLWRNELLESNTLRTIYRKQKKHLLFHHRFTLDTYCATDSLALAQWHSHLQMPSTAPAQMPPTIHVETQNYEGNTPLLAGYTGHYGQFVDTSLAGVRSQMQWLGELSTIQPRHNDNMCFCHVVAYKPRVRKSFDESIPELRQIYQQQKEKAWIADLQKRYPATIYQPVLERLKNELEK